MLTSALIALSLQQSHAFIHLSLKHEVQVPPSPHTDFHKQGIPKASTSHRTQSLPPNPFTHHSPTTTPPVPFHAHESRHNTPISRSKHSQNFPSMSLSPVRLTRRLFPFALHLHLRRSQLLAGGARSRLKLRRIMHSATAMTFCLTCDKAVSDFASFVVCAAGVVHRLEITHFRCRLRRFYPGPIYQILEAVDGRWMVVGDLRDCLARLVDAGWC